MSTSNLLVFGATGAIGSYIIAAIVNARDSFNRIAVFTSPNTLSAKETEINVLRDKGVEILVGDVTNQDDVLKAFDGTTQPSPIATTSIDRKKLIKNRNRHRSISPGTRRHHRPNQPDRMGRRCAANPPLPALRVRHRHRVRPRVGVRETAPGETAGPRCAAGH